MIWGTAEIVYTAFVAPATPKRSQKFAPLVTYGILAGRSIAIRLDDAAFRRFVDDESRGATFRQVFVIDGPRTARVPSAG